MSATDRLRVLGFSGSLRTGSFNSALLRTAVELQPETMAIEVFSLHGIPPFDADVEQRGDPEQVAAFKAAIAAADAVLIACPEYNMGITGVLKNAIDWASRPPGRSPLAGKPAAIVGTTTGGSGTRMAQAMARQVLSALAVPVLPTPFFMLAGARDKFQDGRLTDERSRQQLRRVLDGLGSWASRLASAPRP